LQCCALELTWPWQCGHSIFLRGPDRLFVNNTPTSVGRRITEGQRSTGHCPVGYYRDQSNLGLDFQGLASSGVGASLSQP
jgi:hypothetical protein